MLHAHVKNINSSVMTLYTAMGLLSIDNTVAVRLRTSTDERGKCSFGLVIIKITLAQLLFQFFQRNQNVLVLWEEPVWIKLASKNFTMTNNIPHLPVLQLAKHWSIWGLERSSWNSVCLNVFVHGAWRLRI